MKKLLQKGMKQKRRRSKENGVYIKLSEEKLDEKIVGMLLKRSWRTKWMLQTIYTYVVIQKHSLSWRLCQKHTGGAEVQEARNREVNYIIAV